MYPSLKMSGKTPHGHGVKHSVTKKKGKSTLRNFYIQPAIKLAEGPVHGPSSSLQPDVTPSPMPAQTSMAQETQHSHNEEVTSFGPQYVLGMTDPSDERICVRPYGNDFIPHDTAGSISVIFKGKYEKAWLGWSQVDKEVEDMWFEEFKKKYKWEPQYNARAWKVWGGKCANLVRNAIKVVRNKRCNKQWLSHNVLEELRTKWDDPQYKNKCEINKKNRSSNAGGCIYGGGSISMSEHKKRMAMELSEDLIQPELFKRLNYKENKDQSQPARCIHQKAADAYAAYKTLKETSQAEGSSVDDSTFFLMGISEKNKRRRAYKFGSKTSLLGSASTSTQSTGCTSNKFCLMQQRVNALTEELQFMRAKLSEKDKQLERNSRLMKKILSKFNIDEDSDEGEDDDKMDD